MVSPECMVARLGIYIGNLAKLGVSLKGMEFGYEASLISTDLYMADVGGSNLKRARSPLRLAQLPSPLEHSGHFGIVPSMHSPRSGDGRGIDGVASKAPASKVAVAGASSIVDKALLPSSSSIRSLSSAVVDVPSSKLVGHGGQRPVAGLMSPVTIAEGALEGVTRGAGCEGVGEPDLGEEREVGACSH